LGVALLTQVRSKTLASWASRVAASCFGNGTRRKKHGLSASGVAQAPRIRDAGLDGDVEAGRSLISAAPNELRGYVAVAGYYIGTPNPTYREIVDLAWSMDCGSVASAAKACRVPVRRMMKEARFDHPFSGEISVYRGAAGVTPWKASRGLSWTTSRDVACWFALRSSLGARKPVVVVASVAASKIIFYSDERGEQEVMLGHAVSGFLDPDPTKWISTAERYEAEKEKKRLSHLRVKCERS
jgi:hypothetical protein